MTTTGRAPAQAGPSAVTIQAALDALRQAAAATDELLATMTGIHGDAPVPGLDWTVSETAAHLVAVLRQPEAFASGARDGAAERAALPSAVGTGARLALGNARELDRFGERRIPVLRQSLGSAVEDYAGVITRRRDGAPVEPLLGQEDPAAGRGPASRSPGTGGGSRAGAAAGSPPPSPATPCG